MSSAVPMNSPIFVVGLPRSGTTLLQSLIGAHPRIAAPPELFFLRRILMFADMWGNLDDDDVLRRVVDETLSLPNLAASGFDAERIVERARKGPRTYATVLDAVMTDYAERQGKERWSEKSPMQPADVVWRLFPDAQVVHIIRDPRATVVSNMTKLGSWPDLLSTSDGWRKFTFRNVLAGAERGPAHYLRVRYEDLAQSPRDAMKMVFTFLREEFDPDYVDNPERRRSAVGVSRDLWQAAVLKPISAADVEAWRKEISPVARLRLQASVADVLPVLGYPPPAPAAVRVGHVLNVPFRLVVRARDARAKAARRRISTPEERYRAEQVAHQQRARRMRRVLGRRNKDRTSRG